MERRGEGKFVGVRRGYLVSGAAEGVAARGAFWVRRVNLFAFRGRECRLGLSSWSAGSSGSDGRAFRLGFVVVLGGGVCFLISRFLRFVFVGFKMYFGRGFRR